MPPSKGFCELFYSIHEFPLRSKAVYLNVKRRRWTDLERGEFIGRN